jgi:hypothetical protein
VKEHHLANGVTVLVVERPAAGRVAARMFYRSDIAGEKPGTYGLTHLLEHYLFTGSYVVGTRGALHGGSHHAGDFWAGGEGRRYDEGEYGVRKGGGARGWKWERRRRSERKRKCFRCECKRVGP